MSELLNREQLDRRMAAWEMYYIEHMATTTIARHFKVSRQSIRNWIVSLGGELGDDDIQRAMRDRVRANLAAGQMLCRECDVITPAHDSGLCPMCRGDEEGNDEHSAWLEFESGWLQRNLCGGETVSDVKLHLGDCLDVMATMDADSVDSIVTDPPYFKVKDEPWDRQWDTPREFLAWLDTVLAEFYRILKPNGSLYVFASPKMAARVEVLVAERFNVLNHIVWAKPTGRWQKSSKETYRCWFPSSERIIFAEHYGADNIAKGESGYIAKCDDLRGFVFEPLRAYLDGERERAGVTREQVNAAWQVWRDSPKGGMASHWFSDSQWALPTAENYEWLRGVFAGMNHGGEYLRREYEYLRREYEDLRREYEDLRREYEDLRRPFSVTADVPYTDVWTFPTVAHYPGKHPCEKPLAMMEHIIRASTRPGAVVLDPFMGSGVTGEACHNLERDFVGIELDADYLEIARRRIEHAAMQPTLDGLL